MNSQSIRKWLVLGGLLGVTLLLVWRAPEPETVVVAPTRIAVAPVAGASGTPPTTALPATSFTLAARLPAEGEIVDLFAPPVAEKPKAVAAPVQRIVPVPPPLPYTFVGKMIESGKVKGFVQEGETMRTAGEGDMLGANYRVLAVEDGGVSVMYLPLNVMQTIRKGPDILPARIKPVVTPDDD